jgi:hypothetical protein
MSENMIIAGKPADSLLICHTARLCGPAVAAVILIARFFLVPADFKIHEEEYTY